MRVVFRADSSSRIGSGHIMRCLTLADALAVNGAISDFVCRRLDNNMIAHIRERGYSVHELLPPPAELSTDLTGYEQWLGVDWLTDARQTAELMRTIGHIDWMVVDHYAIDAEWEKYIRRHTQVKHIGIIDDLANRKHDSDFLLDQNLNENMSSRYSGLVPDNCRVFLGPAYALLRSEFIQAKKNLRDRDGRIRHILISFGGADTDNVTAKALRAIKAMGREDIHTDVIIGRSNRFERELKKLCNQIPHCTCHAYVENMAEMMTNADLAIGAGGVTMWERAYLGLPSLTVLLAENQRPGTEAMVSAGAVWNLGFYKDVEVKQIRQAIEKVLANSELVRHMSRASHAIFGETGQLKMNEIVDMVMAESESLTQMI